MSARETIPVQTSCHSTSSVVLRPDGETLSTISSPTSVVRLGISLQMICTGKEQQRKVPRRNMSTTPFPSLMEGKECARGCRGHHWGPSRWGRSRDNICSFRAVWEGSIWVTSSKESWPPPRVEKYFMMGTSSLCSVSRLFFKLRQYLVLFVLGSWPSGLGNSQVVSYTTSPAWCLCDIALDVWAGCLNKHQTRNVWYASDVVDANRFTLFRYTISQCGYGNMLVRGSHNWLWRM